jgi:CheY-like chemotaxis protein
LHLADDRLESASAEARVHLTRAIEATTRAVAVTGRLLAFARHGELHGEPIAPGQLLAGLAEILSPTLGAGLTLRIEADGELPALYADRAQLESVLINLAHNARDAMPRGGMLVLRATALSSAAEETPSELTSGAFLRLSVIDQGEGMPPEVIARVTEPFFTTKPKGKGTGLGLAMARGFAEQSGGRLTIESTLGSGTTVSLWLPQTQNTDIAPSSIGVSVTAVAAPASGTAFTVLLAEDQPEVREVLALHLEEHGFTIMEAEHAAGAINLFDRGFRPDAVVTDFSMPGKLDGIGLIQEARERWPCLPAVLVTGDTGVTIPEQLEALEREGAFLLLRKPVSAKVLVDCLSRVLGNNL